MTITVGLMALLFLVLLLAGSCHGSSEPGTEHCLLGLVERGDESEIGSFLALLHKESSLDHYKKVVLHHALMLNKPAIIKMALSETVGFYDVDPLGDDDALFIHTALTTSTSTEAIKNQLGQSLNVSITDGFGNTPLHYAARHENLDGIRMLLEWEADIDSTNNAGGTPLHEASMKNCPLAVELLLKNKAHVNFVDKSGKTALHHATRTNCHDAFTVLLDASNIDLNAVDADGKTALRYAVEGWNTNFIIMLLAARANHSIEASDGLTPLQYAESHGRSDIVQLFEVYADSGGCHCTIS